ncbi:MAG: hypothetical protein IPM38_11285 [Ignavibacteria bacterium]|nr:hypothetical protein [Ignavibacteria bacterium]
MKEKLLIIILLSLNFNESNSQNIIQKAEILITNKSLYDIIIYVSPIGAIFSGFNSTSSENYRKYSLIRSNPDRDPFWPIGPDSIKYITGGSKIIVSNDYIVIDFDDGDYFDNNSNRDKVLGGISYGLWKFEIFNIINGIKDTILIEPFYLDERDINHGVTIGFAVDLFMIFDDTENNTNVDLLFAFTGGGDTLSITDSLIDDRTIKAWHKVGLLNNPIIPGRPNRGLFNSFQLYNFPGICNRIRCFKTS